MASVALKNNWLEDGVKRGHAGVHAMPVRLTPAFAQALLDRNPDNRSIGVNRVELYAHDIANGRWRENGEPIIVSREGLLNDGQHRCAAVVRAGVAIPALVVFGVERDTRTTTNQGKTKGAGDYAAMGGLQNANVVAAIARMVLSVEEVGSFNAPRRVSNAAVLEYITQNRDGLQAAASFAHGHHRSLQKIVAGSVFGYALYRCSAINKPAALEFFESMASGELLVAGDPAFVARSRMLALGRSARAAKAEIMFHAWNAHRKGETRALIRVNGSFPALV